MVRIINAAADAYRSVIPADCWHDPYMPSEELDREIAAGVSFIGFGKDHGLVGVMGVQRMGNVNLIRHAYVDPASQGQGVGSLLIDELRRRSDRPLLVGTWRAAAWAVRFYERHGFRATADRDARALLRTYWTVPDRQIDTSVVLSVPALDAGATARLIAEAHREWTPRRSGSEIVDG